MKTSLNYFGSSIIICCPHSLIFSPLAHGSPAAVSMREKRDEKQKSLSLPFLEPKESVRTLVCCLFCALKVKFDPSRSHQPPPPEREKEAVFYWHNEPVCLMGLRAHIRQQINAREVHATFSLLWSWLFWSGCRERALYTMEHEVDQGQSMHSNSIWLWERLKKTQIFFLSKT